MVWWCNCLCKLCLCKLSLLLQVHGKKKQGYSINGGQVVRARVTSGAGITKLIGKPRVKYCRYHVVMLARGWIKRSVQQCQNSILCQWRLHGIYSVMWHHLLFQVHVVFKFKYCNTFTLTTLNAFADLYAHGLATSWQMTKGRNFANSSMRNSWTVSESSIVSPRRTIHR